MDFLLLLQFNDLKLKISDTRGSNHIQTSKVRIITAITLVIQHIALSKVVVNVGAAMIVPQPWLSVIMWVYNFLILHT